MGVGHSYKVARPAESIMGNLCFDDCCFSLSEDTGVGAAVFQLYANDLPKSALGVYKHTGNVKDYTTYNEALNSATTEIRTSRRTFEQQLAGDIKTMTARISTLL